MIGDVFPRAAGGWRRLPALALLAALASCASWREVSSHEDWSLYVRPGAGVDVPAYERLLEPSLAAVEAELGAFEEPVRVHAWTGGVELESGNRGRIADGEDAGLIEGEVGVARVRAFHVRSDPFGPGGVFLGEASAGSAVHELVHARMSELDRDLPLWLEEGVAMLLGDGVLDDSGATLRWVRDGLCAWPMSRLRALELTDAQLEELLALRAEDGHSVDENLLIHFLGWALVFDLYRQDPGGGWEAWYRTHQLDPGLPTVRARLERSLDPDTLLVWLGERLDDPDPAVRRAAVRGIWRVAGPADLQRLVAALRTEAAAARALDRAFQRGATPDEVAAAFADLEAYWQE